jgi:predicted ester cyclase/quinol monooxygenase YgiN
MFRATLRMQVKAGKDDEFAEAWEKVAQEARRTPGSVRQTLSRPAEGTFVITTDWVSPEAFTAFERSPEQDALTAPLRALRGSATMEVAPIIRHVESDAALSVAEANERTVVEHFRALEAGDVDRALAAFAPDVVNHRIEPGSPPGRAGLHQTLTVVLASFPAATWTVEGIVAGVAEVTARVLVEGEAHGVIMGVRARNQRVRWRHTHTFGMKDGQVVFHDAIRDDRGLLRQLGFPVKGPELGGLGGGFGAGSPPA